MQQYALCALAFVSLLLLYMFFGVLFEQKRLSFGHEASLILFIGSLISFLAYYSNSTEFLSLVKFDENLFFYFLLPPIVFASGFNLRRNVFFSNLLSVFIFGVLSTLLQFFLFAIMLTLIQSSLSPQEIMLISSLLCSSDVVAAIAVVRYEE